MIFLNPTILLGLLAASIPIILHFLNLRKIKRIEFSTLAFLKELQKSKIKKIKIKQWLLLLLRVLIIIFLVLSFSRPTLQSTSLPGFNSSAKTTAVIIIDNTFSMSIVDENGTMLNQAKRIAKDLVQTYNKGDDVYLILTSEAKSKQLTSEKVIEEIDISEVALPLSKSLRVAKELLANRKNFNKEIYVLSDFQNSMYLEVDSSNAIIIPDSRIYTVQFQHNGENNLSLTNLEIKNQIFEVGKVVKISSETTNYTNSNSGNTLNSLFQNDKRVAQKSISVGGKETHREIFNANIDKPGFVEITSKLEDDAILHDNKYYNYFITPENIKILFCGNSEKDFFYISSALKTNSEKSINYSFMNSDKINEIDLGNFDVVVLIGNVDEGFAEKAKGHISNGGGLIVFPTSNEFLLQLGLPKYLQLFTRKDNTSINSFENTDFTHPIFEGLFSEKTVEIESPSFYKYYKLQNTSTGRVIISLQDKSAFLSEHRIGAGKILLFNVAPNLEWSDFPLKNIFAPLLNRSISYLVSNFENDKKYVAGDVLTADVSKRKSNQITILRPDQSGEIINVTNSEVSFLNYENSNLTGIYKFYSNNILLDVKMVNYNILESNLKLLSSNEIIEKLKTENNEVTILSPTEDYKEKIMSTRFGSELWQMFLILAFVLALLEMIVAKNSKNDLAEI